MAAFPPGWPTGWHKHMHDTSGEKKRGGRQGDMPSPVVLVSPYSRKRKRGRGGGVARSSSGLIPRRRRCFHAAKGKKKEERETAAAVGLDPQI